jgi:hypothetical protein
MSLASAEKQFLAGVSNRLDELFVRLDRLEDTLRLALPAKPAPVKQEKPAQSLTDH